MDPERTHEPIKKTHCCSVPGGAGAGFSHSHTETLDAAVLVGLRQVEGFLFACVTILALRVFLKSHHMCLKSLCWCKCNVKVTPIQTSTQHVSTFKCDQQLMPDQLNYLTMSLQIPQKDVNNNTVLFLII